MNYLEEILLSSKNPQLRELQISSSTEESTQSHSEDETTYSFVNTRKRAAKVSNETNLNLSDCMNALTIRDEETIRTINLSSPEENDISLEFLSPENERIKYHADNDGSITIRKDSERYSINFTEKVRVKPKIISDIPVNIYHKIKNLLQPILNENTNVDSGINSFINDSQNESQETDDSLDSSLEDSHLNVGEIPEIIMEHLKSLENAINQTIRESDTNDHIRNLFPIFLKEGASGIRLYTKKAIYLEDMCNKPKRSKQSREAADEKDYKNVHIHYSSRKNSSPHINVDIGENLVFVNKRKIPKFEIEETVKLNLSEDEEKKENDTLTEEEEEKNEEEELEEEEEKEFEEDEEKNEEEELEEEEEEELEEEEEKELEEEELDEEEKEELEEEEKKEELYEEEEKEELEEEEEKEEEKKEEEEEEEEEEDLVPFKDSICNLKKTNQLSIEDHLEFEKFSPTVNSTLHIANEDSNLLTKNNLVQNEYTNTLEETILVENENNESPGIEEVLQIQSKVKEDIMIYGHELETILEETEENKNSLLIREKSKKIENETSRNVEENKEPEAKRNSNSEITGKLIVNNKSTKKMFQFPFEIDVDDESTMDITLEIKVVKKDEKT